MGLQWTGLLQLLASFLLLTLALGLRPLVVRLEGDVLSVLGYLPWLLAAVTAILAWQFNRLRFLLLAAISATAYGVVQLRLQTSLADPIAFEAFAGLSYALPITLTALLLLPEHGIVNGFGLTSLATVLGLGLFFAGLAPWFAGWFPQHREWFALRQADFFILSWVSTALFATAAGIGLGALLWRYTACEAAILGTLAAMFLVLALLPLDHVSVILFTAAGCAQLFGIIRSSHAMAYRDDLTGLLSRRALNEQLRSLGRRYCVAMLDVDHFKKFNDKHGHDVGDQALRLVASRIARVGGGGKAFRYGGEEFCVIFPRKSVSECIEPLEKVRELIAEYRMVLRDKSQRPAQQKEGMQRRGQMATKFRPDTVAVTISVGLAERSDDHATYEEVLRAADKQLYRAKRAGRNRLKH
jgi:diguanylate cyclase (GGDEF)-like protein